MMTMVIPSAPTADRAPRASEWMDALNRGIVRCIQNSGEVSPSAEIDVENDDELREWLSAADGVQWTEYAAAPSSVDEGVGWTLHMAVRDLRRFFPHPLLGTELGSDGRPILYAACLGLLLYRRSTSAALSTFLAVLSFLVDELGLPPDRRTETPGACRRPPLHLLARSCCPSAVRALLERGADPSLPDDEGFTALMACCMPDVPSEEEGGPSDGERIDTVEVLLEALAEREEGGGVGAGNYRGWGALHFACEGLHAALVGRLLNAEADASHRSLRGESPLGVVRRCRIDRIDDFDDEGDDSAKAVVQAAAGACETLLLSALEERGQLEEAMPFLEEERKAIELMRLVEKVLLPAARKPEANGSADESGGGDQNTDGREAQDRRIITALVKHLGLDPASLFRDDNKNTPPGTPSWPDRSNLYEEIHRRTVALLPSGYLQVHRSAVISTDDADVALASLDRHLFSETLPSPSGVRTVDRSLLLRNAFVLHRERGRVPRLCEALTDLIVGPLQRVIAFGIPGKATLEAIASRAGARGVVEMGAGTGYWSAMLTSRGVDVLAYDAQPPGDGADGKENVYFYDRLYFPVGRGDASSVFGGTVGAEDGDVKSRALLIVWPNNPDAQVNSHQLSCDGEGPPSPATLPPVWDLECLERYHRAGGDMVIYAGEREARIKPMEGSTAPPDCGFCSSRAFQSFLWEMFDLVETVECPRWWLKEDDVTIWVRKEDTER